MNNRFRLGRVEISAVNMEDALNIIQNDINNSNATRYVCLTNVRAAYYGNHNSEYERILNNSLLTLPDSKTMEWYAHKVGEKSVERVSGQDFFDKICDISLKYGYSHYFYGSSDEIVKKMISNIREKYSGLKVVGAVPAPYAPVENLVNEEVVNDINSKEPTIVWVGLSAPKQEEFIDLIKKDIKRSLLIGVGLVFDYNAGSVKRAPGWMQKIGLEGWYRMMQQPQKIKRFIKPIIWYFKEYIRAR